ncbi:hypothetical protein KBD75_01890 [Candidatus Woesebacteria bacterium]|nr:hypothetical protein [Candidatus Woesebacteria bacterium]
MTLLPGLYTEHSQQPENMTLERAPYKLNQILPMMFLKHMSPKIVEDIGTRYPKKDNQIKSIFAITRYLFPVDKGGKFTAIRAPLNRSSVLESVANQRLATQIDETLWHHIESISDTLQEKGLLQRILTPIKRSLTKRTVSLVKNLTDQTKKYPELFWNIFIRDKENSSKPNAIKHRSISDLLGVFENITKYENEKTETSPKAAALIHSQKMVALSSFLYLHDVSIHGGYFHGNSDQKDLDPPKIQESSKKSLNLLIDSSWDNLIPNNQNLATAINNIKNPPIFKKSIEAMNHGTHDPNIQLNYNPDTGTAKFEDNPYYCPEGINPLTLIPQRFFNQDLTKYIDISAYEYLNLSPEELQAFHEGSDTHVWQDITQIEKDSSDIRWPIFAVSIVDNSDVPNNLSRYRGSQGKNMLHFDIRYDQENILVNYDASHSVIDGLRTKDYYDFIGDILGADSTGEDSLRIFHHPIQEKSHNPYYAPEYTNFLELSDFVVGKTYDFQKLDELLTQVNAKFDRGLSMLINESVTEAIKNGEAATILEGLLSEYPQYRNKYHSSMQIPEIIPDPNNEIETIIYQFRLAIDNPQILLDQKIDEKIRNLFSPKISPIHLFDLSLRRLGGVLNCVGGLSPHQRLQLATVGQSEDAISAAEKYLENAEYQLTESEYNNIVTTLSDNLLEQSLAFMGCGTPSFLAMATQEFKEPVGGAAELIGQTELVEMTNKTLIQSSTTGKGNLLWFITAGSRFNRSQSIAVGDCIRKDGKTGALTMRSDLSNGYLLKAINVNTAVEIPTPEEFKYINTTKYIRFAIETLVKNNPDSSLLEFISKKILPMRKMYLENETNLIIFDEIVKQYLTNIMDAELDHTIKISFAIAQLLANGPVNN